METKMSFEDATDAPSVVESDPVVETPAVQEAVEAIEPEAIEEKPEPDPYADIEDLGETSEDEPAEDAEPAEEEAESEEAELIEFNFGGNKLEVEKSAIPEELAAKMQEFSDNTWKDYTKGKQEVAESAKANTADREAITKMQSLDGETQKAYSYGLRLRQEIEELTTVDDGHGGRVPINMEALWQSNPDEARRRSDAVTSKSSRFQQVVAHVDQQEQAMDTAQQEEAVRRSDIGKATLDKRIKDFSTKVAPDLVDYVVKGGMSQADAEQWAMNPQVTEFAYKAMMYDRMQAAPKPKAVPVQAKPITPMKSAGKATTSTNDPNTMTTDQYAKWRKAGNG